MDFQAEYRSKLRTPAEAVRAVKTATGWTIRRASASRRCSMRRSPPGATSCTM